MYFPDEASDGFCWPDGGGEKLEYPAYFGQFGCDPPVGLVRLIFEKMAHDNPDLDVIFLTGDVVAHAVPLEPPPEESFHHASYESTLLILEIFAGLLNEFFPNVPVLPVPGNNDTKYHYQPAVGTYAPSYYNEYWDFYFTQHPGNANLKEYAEMEKTFKAGAYYRTQIDEHLHVLALNTLPYNSQSVADDQELKDSQMQWFEDQLKQSGPDDKFVILSHIYTTLRGLGGEFESIWFEDHYQDTFYQLAWEYRDKILLENTGHDHLSDFRTHSAKLAFNKEKKCYDELENAHADDFFLTKILNPAVTPTRSTSPGFTTMEYSSASDEFTEVVMTFLQMGSTYKKPKDATHE
jgi:hypothetical protein